MGDGVAAQIADEGVEAVAARGGTEAADRVVVGEAASGAGGAGTGGGGAGGVGGAEPPLATSDNMYEISADAVKKDADVRVEGRGNPDRIMHHDKLRLSGVTDVTVAEHATVADARTQIEAAGGPPAVGGLPQGQQATGSMLPAPVGENVPVPLETRPASPNIDKPLPTELRTHAENPALHDPANPKYNPDAHSANNPTTQINTAPGRGPKEYLDPSTGTFGPPNAEAHMPAGGRDRGPTGLGATPENPAGTGPAGPGRRPAEPGDYSRYSERPTEGGPVHETYGRPGQDSLPEGMADDVDVNLDPARYGAAGPYKAPGGGGGAPGGGGGAPSGGGALEGMPVADQAVRPSPGPPGLVKQAGDQLNVGGRDPVLPHPGEQQPIVAEARAGQGFDPSRAVDPGQVYGMSVTPAQGFDPSRAVDPGQVYGMSMAAGERVAAVGVSGDGAAETTQQYGSSTAESAGQGTLDEAADGAGAPFALFGQQLPGHTPGHRGNTTEPGFDPSQSVDPGQAYGMSVVAAHGFDPSGFDPSQGTDPGQAYGMSIASTQAFDPGQDHAAQASNQSAALDHPVDPSQLFDPSRGEDSAGNDPTAGAAEQSAAVASQGTDQQTYGNVSPNPYVPAENQHVETYQPEQVYQPPQHTQNQNQR